jgi:hypothetical protein
MRSHNQDIDRLLDKYLPTRYSKLVITKLKEKGVDVTDGMVRNARNGRSAANSVQIMTALIELANEERTAQEQLQGLISITE